MIHTSRGRSRGEQKLDRQKCYDGLAEGKPDEKAREAFEHKPYTVSDYLKKVGIDVTENVSKIGSRRGEEENAK